MTAKVGGEDTPPNEETYDISLETAEVDNNKEGVLQILADGLVNQTKYTLSLSHADTQVTQQVAEGQVLSQLQTDQTQAGTTWRTTLFDAGGKKVKDLSYNPNSSLPGATVLGENTTLFALSFLGKTDLSTAMVVASQYTQGDHAIASRSFFTPDWLTANAWIAGPELTGTTALLPFGHGGEEGMVLLKEQAGNRQAQSILQSYSSATLAVQAVNVRALPMVQFWKNDDTFAQNPTLAREAMVSVLHSNTHCTYVYIRMEKDRICTSTVHLSGAGTVLAQNLNYFIYTETEPRYSIDLQEYSPGMNAPDTFSLNRNQEDVNTTPVGATSNWSKYDNGGGATITSLVKGTGITLELTGETTDGINSQQGIKLSIVEKKSSSVQSQVEVTVGYLEGEKMAKVKVTTNEAGLGENIYEMEYYLETPDGPIGEEKAKPLEATASPEPVAVPEVLVAEKAPVEKEAVAEAAPGYPKVTAEPNAQEEEVSVQGNIEMNETETFQFESDTSAEKTTLSWIMPLSKGEIDIDLTSDSSGKRNLRVQAPVKGKKSSRSLTEKTEENTERNLGDDIVLFKSEDSTLGVKVNYTLALGGEAILVEATVTPDGALHIALDGEKIRAEAMPAGADGLPTVSVSQPNAQGKTTTDTYTTTPG
ncbi:MAG TPA: hypothetical protein DCR93_16635 [Cytophagales bacterium]|nr:hypothetical protein [Cytophagales bacterium]